MADDLITTIGGVEGARSSGEALQIGVKALKLGDAAFDLGRVVQDDVEDVVAGSFPTFTERHDLPDLAQGQSDGLRGPDELEALQDVVVIVAVAARGAVRRREDADLLVVPQGLDAQAAAVGQLSDSHRPTLPLDPPVH